ncbi:MAG: hypothetical protein Q8S18_02735 [Bacteroidales bacterium]|nr:hypothetical protein [Bacteroidales bacterium]
MERGEITSFKTQQIFSDDFNLTVIFFGDGTLLSIKVLPPENIVKYLEKHNYKIYKKFDDYRFNWGVYKISNDTVILELQEKVHQWGFIDICRWQGVLKENELQILPINKELHGGLDFYTFSQNGITLKTANESLFEKAAINPKLSWVNN